MRGIQTSPYSFVSHISKSGRRLLSCSLQRTMGCIVPDTPLKETEALSSRFAGLVFAIEVRVSMGWDAHEKKRQKAHWLDLKAELVAAGPCTGDVVLCRTVTTPDDCAMNLVAQSTFLGCEVLYQ